MNKLQVRDFGFALQIDKRGKIVGRLDKNGNPPKHPCIVVKAQNGEVWLSYGTSNFEEGQERKNAYYYIPYSQYSFLHADTFMRVNQIARFPEEAFIEFLKFQKRGKMNDDDFSKMESKLKY